MIDWNTVKYFRPEEFQHPELLRPQMILMLDRLRMIYDAPLVVSSSWRSAEHNKEVGGTIRSSHCCLDVLRGGDGLYSGIDITTPTNHFTSPQLFRVLQAAVAVGYNRIGLYTDSRHVHLDCETRLPQNVLWID